MIGLLITGWILSGLVCIIGMLRWSERQWIPKTLSLQEAILIPFLGGLVGPIWYVLLLICGIVYVGCRLKKIWDRMDEIYLIQPRNPNETNSFTLDVRQYEMMDETENHS